MGKLVDGKWQTTSIVTSDKKGAYDRLPRTFRDFISDEHEVFKPSLIDTIFMFLMLAHGHIEL